MGGRDELQNLPKSSTFDHNATHHMDPMNKKEAEQQKKKDPAESRIWI